SELVPRARIESAIRSRLRDARRRVVVSVSHDDYTQVVGGVQLCLSIEQTAFAAEGAVYVNLNPVQPLPMLAPLTRPRDLLLNVLCDGAPVGPAPAREVLGALSALAEDDAAFVLAVHALHGHS